ncbi:MAG TPA: zinc-ribbon domain-containing protein, partial [Myxococcota bacterium]
MIVTCPGCASKYRVRNEAVPAEGARMRCPKCETLFLAKPPQNGEGGNDDVTAAPFGAPGFAAPQTSTGYPTGQLLAQPGGMQQPVVPYQPSGQTAGGFPSLPPQAATPFSAPFSAAPSLPPQPAPFGASLPPQPSPFGQPGGFVPPQPNTSGPLTSMMRSFDAAALAQAQQAQQQLQHHQQQSAPYPSTSAPAAPA